MGFCEKIIIDQEEQSMSKMENGWIIDGLDELEMENTAVEDLDSENINLIFLGIDQSGSMETYRREMKTALAGF